MSWSTIDWQDIRCAESEGILTITLSRVKRLNAFTVTMASELIEAFTAASEDDTVKAVILTGEGSTFCAGMELAPEAGGNVFGLDEEMRPTLQDMNNRLDDPEIIAGVRDTGGRVTLAMFDCKKPIIAAINGVAVGVGATLTLACDIRLAATQAKFGFVFGKIGIVPDACSSWFLPRVVGLPKALEWTMSGVLVSASDAIEAGLIKEICGDDQLMQRAFALAHEYTNKRSPVSVALIRQMIYRNSALAHPLEAHKIESLGIFYTSLSDGKEGVSSFLQRREPDFRDPASAMPDFYPWWN